MESKNYMQKSVALAGHPSAALSSIQYVYIVNFVLLTLFLIVVTNYFLSLL